METPCPTPPVAAVDIGSNSGRIVVVERDQAGHLEVLEEARASLRLVRDLDRERELTPEAIERTLHALRGFRAVAVGAGAARTMVVATAAVREAPNGEQLVRRIRDETGFEVDIIDGEQEARYAFLGAVYGLPVENGLLLDIGGGSMQIARFRGRQMQEYWTLPLGSLRLSDRFLQSDPPTTSELDRLSEHVRETLRNAGVPPLEQGQTLVGTGGTIRNLAKVDRRLRSYPIPRIHAYVLTLRRLVETVDLLTSQLSASRTAVPGLNADRADSITGGAVCLRTVMETLAAPEVVVSGQGMREGIILESYGDALPSPQAVRHASIRALASRFATWKRSVAERRTSIAAEILSAADSEISVELRETLFHATTLLDIGRSVDYYRRYEHTSMIVTSAVLGGFLHRSVALLAAIVQSAGSEKTSFKELSPLVRGKDRPALHRMGTILALADELERLLPAASAQVECWRYGQETVLSAALADFSRLEKLAERFRRVFGRALRFQVGGADS